MMLDAVEIQKIIPHRYPFLLVDRITEIVPGERAVGYKNITMNDYFFAGHFPEEPVMPGVLIVEALAQVGAVTMLSLEEFKGKTAYFGGINKTKIRRKVIPGDRLDLQIDITKQKGSVGVGKVVASVDGEIAVTGELTFIVK